MHPPNIKEEHHEQRPKQQKEYKKRASKNPAGKKNSQEREKEREDEPGNPDSNVEGIAIFCNQCDLASSDLPFHTSAEGLGRVAAKWNLR
jgi:hypothetical protein